MSESRALNQSETLVVAGVLVAIVSTLLTVCGIDRDVSLYGGGVAMGLFTAGVWLWVTSQVGVDPE